MSVVPKKKTNHPSPAAKYSGSTFQLHFSVVQCSHSFNDQRKWSWKTSNYFYSNSHPPVFLTSVMFLMICFPVSPGQKHNYCWQLWFRSTGNSILVRCSHGSAVLRVTGMWICAVQLVCMSSSCPIQPFTYQLCLTPVTINNRTLMHGG